MRLNLVDATPETEAYVQAVFRGREVPVIGAVFAEKVYDNYSALPGSVLPEKPVKWELEFALWAEEEPHTDKGERTMKIYDVGIIANQMYRFLGNTPEAVEHIKSALQGDKIEAGRLIARRILYAMEARTMMDDMRTGVRDLLSLEGASSLEESLGSFLRAEEQHES